MSPRIEQIGDATLYLGDCLEVMTEMEAGSVDAVVTDPPYKISQQYSASTDADNLEAVSMIWPLSPELLRASRPGAVMAMFYDTRILPLALNAVRRGGWKYLRNLTFYRRWGGASRVHGWMSTSDFILIFAAPGAPVLFNGPCRHDVYIRTTREVDVAHHPAMKPLEAVAHIAENISRPAHTILDPFMGSGTTGVACMNLGRKFIGIEIEPKYFDIACRRIDLAARQEKLPLEAG